MRRLIHPAIEEISLPNVLYALSDPVRLSIVIKLSETGQQSCGELELPVAKSTASHHFRVLREAGIIQMESQGTQFINSLREDDLEQLFPGLLNIVVSSETSKSADQPA